MAGSICCWGRCVPPPTDSASPRFHPGFASSPAQSPPLLSVILSASMTPVNLAQPFLSCIVFFPVVKFSHHFSKWDIIRTCTFAKQSKRMMCFFFADKVVSREGGWRFLGRTEFAPAFAHPWPIFCMLVLCVEKGHCIFIIFAVKKCSK